MSLKLSVDKVTGHKTGKFSVSSGTGDYLFFPHDKRFLTVEVTPTVSAKIQSTNSDSSEVRNGTAIYRDWPRGVVTGYTKDVVVHGVTALRLVAIDGAATMEVLAL